MAKLVMTLEQMQDRDAWLQLRNTGIGGSDAAVILGVSPWKSALTLWAEKTGQKDPDDLSRNQRVYWGTKNESNIADWFMEETGKKVFRRGMMRSEEHPFMLASVDREVVGEKAGLEIKTAGIDQAKKWMDDEVPDAYYLQCQWYMAVTGYERWYIAVLIGGNEARWKCIERNEEQIRVLIEAAERFWQMVESKTPPLPDGTKSSGDTLGDMYPGKRDGQVLDLRSPDVVQAYENMKRFAEAEKFAGKAKEKAKQVIMSAMGEYEEASINGHRVTWRTQTGRVTIDTKRLQAEMPDVYEKYKKVGKQSRKFLG
nr:MAG TPA: Exonuclease [Caudoviricetes sp.]